MHQSHNDFLERILSHLEPKPCESVNIYDSLGKILASNIKATHPFPAKDTVSANGYAIICSNTNDAPINLKIIGESTAESPFHKKLENGQTVRVYIGSALPEGADTVIEDSECEVHDDIIRIKKPALQNQNILDCGIDFQTDEIMLRKGSKVSSIDIAIAASMSLTTLEVSQIPNIGVMEVGDMLIIPGEDVNSEQTISTTDIILNYFIKSEGANATDFGMISENEKSIENKLNSIVEMDLIVTTGGISKSSSDALINILGKNNNIMEKINLNLNEDISIIFSKIGTTPILCLPSHPISAYIACILFLKPIILYLNNTSEKNHFNEVAILDRDLDINDLKMDYICSQLTTDDGKTLKAMPASSYDKMLMSTLLSSDCLVQVNKNGCKKGFSVVIIPLKK